jgi:hypothetical protein
MKSVRQLMLPYCVILLENGRLAVLNRDYRHLGESRVSREARETKGSDEIGTWMPHEEYWGPYLEKGSVKYKGISRAALDEICWKPLKQQWEDRQFYIGWLYHDASIPTRSKPNWKAYAARLEKLAKYGD